MLTDLQKEYKTLTAAVKVMKATAIELRSKGGEPSNNFKKLLCEKAARLKEVSKKIEEVQNAQQSDHNGQDNP
nr:MAG TPA: hypothetical protein [Caudoviricetes sp.]